MRKGAAIHAIPSCMDAERHIVPRCRVGVMAFNESKNIKAALSALSSQRGPHLDDVTITVIASGCTDDTAERVREAIRDDERITLIEQARREGKAAAIRVFLDELDDGDVAVITGGDSRLEEGALEALVTPLCDPSVGMSGGHPIPVNDPGTVMGGVVHLLWELHHVVALESPKLGELIAFRALPSSLVNDTAVDEASIESLNFRRGLRLVYVPEAQVRIRGPHTISDYLAQRRRIHAGHLHLRKTAGYSVTTLSLRQVLSSLWSSRRRSVRWLTSVVLAATLEAAARFLGGWDELVGKDHRIWKPIASTKDLTT